MLPYQFQPTLAIKELDVDEDAREVRIEAQPDGLFAALLRLVGLSGRSKLKMNANGFWMQAQNFTGRDRTYCPLANVASSIMREAKPVEYLFIGGGLMMSAMGTIVGGEQTIGLVILIVALGALVAFFVANQRVTIGVVTNGSTAVVLKVKAKGANLDDLRAAARIAEELIDVRSSGNGLAAPPAADELLEPTAPVPIAKAKVAIECPHCGVRLRIRSDKKGTDVTCPGCEEEFVA